MKNHIAFQDSLDQFIKECSPHTVSHDVEETPRRSKTGTKTVVINEDKNQIHIYTDGRDPIYNLELKEPKKGILKTKKPQSEERLTIKLPALPDDLSPCHSETKKQIFHKRTPSEDNRKPPLVKLPINITFCAFNDAENNSNLDNVLTPVSGTTPTRSTPTLSPSTNHEQLETFGDYYHKAMTKSTFLKVPDVGRQGHSLFSPVSPRGTSAFKSEHPNTETDLIYVPIQSQCKSTAKAHLNVFQQGAIDMLDSRKSITEDEIDASRLLRVGEKPQLKSSFQAEVREAVLATENKHLHPVWSDESHDDTLERLRRRPRIGSGSDYQFMSGLNSPRESSGVPKRDSMGFGTPRSPFCYNH